MLNRSLRLAPLAVLAALAFPTIAIPADSRPIDMPFKDLNGRKVHIRDYRGKPVVLNFWATWCVPCREEMPMFAEVAKQYTERGITFIAASLDSPETRPKIPEFLSHMASPFRFGSVRRRWISTISS